MIRAARYEEIGIYDYLAIRESPEGFHPWVAASQVMSVTSRARILLDAINVTEHSTADLCSGAASMDLLSDGRFELGLALPEPAPGTRSRGGTELGAAVDAVALAIAGAWSDRRPGFLRNEPGRTDPDISRSSVGRRTPLWICGSDQDTLTAAAGSADGWSISTASLSGDQIVAAARRLDGLAEDLGRDPASIRRRLTLVGELTAQRTGFLRGPAGGWVDDLAPLVLEHGFSVLIVDPPAAERYGMMAFAAQVVPALKGLVQRERSQSRSVAPESTAQSVIPMERAGNWGAKGELPVADRPVAPRIGARRHTAIGVRNSRWLRSVHGHLREELADIQDLAEQVADQEIEASVARETINRMALSQAKWDLGAYCAMFDRELDGHHRSEDESLFPMILKQEPRLSKVISRLTSEHEVIAEVISRLDRALVELINGREVDQSTDTDRGGGVAGVRAVADELADLLLSHLAYEEDQLAGGLSVLDRPT